MGGAGGERGEVAPPLVLERGFTHGELAVDREPTVAVGEQRVLPSRHGAEALGQADDDDGVQVEADGGADRRAQHALAEAADPAERCRELGVDGRANAPGAGASSTASSAASRSSAPSTASNASRSSSGQRRRGPRVAEGVAAARPGPARPGRASRSRPRTRRAGPAAPATNSASSTAACATMPGRGASSGGVVGRLAELGARAAIAGGHVARVPLEPGRPSRRRRRHRRDARSGPTGRPGPDGRRRAGSARWRGTP